MRTVDYDKMAALLVEKSRLRAGDMVLIQTHQDGFPLADALYVACFQKGAVPTVGVSREEAHVRASREAAPADFGRTAAHFASLIGASDVVFILCTQYRNPALPSQIPQAALQAYMKGRIPVQEVTYDGKRRIIITDFPVRAQAEFFGVDFDRYHDMFWNAMEIDYGALAERVRRIAAFLKGKEHVRIRTAKGTDVTLRIGGRPVLEDIGEAGLPGEPSADLLVNLPTGEACLAPHEDGAEGKVVFDFAFIKGKRVIDLVARFEGGRARLESAAEGFEAARDYFEAGTGNAYTIAELGIGANPAITEPFGSILMDEKITGTVHLALGDNRTLGGNNQSSIHQDMVILRPEVTCDDALLMADGELKI